MTLDTYTKYDPAFFDRPCQHPGCNQQAIVARGVPARWLCLKHHTAETKRL